VVLMVWRHGANRGVVPVGKTVLDTRSDGPTVESAAPHGVDLPSDPRVADLGGQPRYTGRGGRCHEADVPSFFIDSSRTTVPTSAVVISRLA
jgi:hypothetical protein